MRHRYTATFRDEHGDYIADGTVAVYLAGTGTAANIYTDVDSATHVHGVTTDTTGRYTFYVDRFDYNSDQTFKIVCSKTGYISLTIDNITIEDACIQTYTISADTTVTTDVYAPLGCIYTVATGKTLTFSGKFDGSMSQHFAGLGTVVFGTGAVKEVYPEWWGAVGDDSTNNTTAFVSAVASLGTYGKLKLGSGIYRGYMSVRKSYVTIEGNGSANTIIKLPDDVVNEAPVILELGNSITDDEPYTNINVRGLTLDGNRSGTAIPTVDTKGWGFAATYISDSTWEDVRAVNCWTGGHLICINSNFFRAIGLYSYNCGHAAGLGGDGSASYFGIDIQSSKYGIIQGISDSDRYGVRILDNCWGINADFQVYNAIVNGVAVSAATANECRSNNIKATVYDGCTDGGFVISGEVLGCNFDVATYSVAGSGVYLLNSTTYYPDNNNFTIATHSSGNCGLLVTNGNNNNFNINSYLDGRTGAQGTYFAIDITGNDNKVIAHVEDSATWQVRGIVFRAGAEENEVVSYTWNNTGDPFYDLGTRTKFNYTTGIGADIASDASIYIPLKGSLFTITGTTGISSIIAAYNGGRTITLLFAGTGGVYPIVTDGSNLKLNGNFTALSASDTLTLVSDGTNWYEVSRCAV